VPAVSTPRGVDASVRTEEYVVAKLEDANRLVWPEYYPANVPPTEAVDAGGEAYRIVRSIPPQAIDFRSSVEDYRARGLEVPAHKFWQACGTSVYTELEGCRTTRQRYPALRERRIAKGLLLAAHGKMMKTEGGHPSHMTVWFRVNATPEQSFLADAEKTQ
jgi:hypothetical protein